MIKKLEKPVAALAWLSALLGGVVLLAVMLMTTVSVSGMSIFKLGKKLEKSYEIIIEPLLSLGPIPGESEMVEAGMAFIIFAFLPIVTLNRGHAEVAILTGFFGKGINRLIDFVADGLMLAVASLLGYQHYLGTVDKFNNGEISWILYYPIWWGYGAALFGAVVFVIISAYCVLRSGQALVTGRSVASSGAVH